MNENQLREDEGRANTYRHPGNSAAIKRTGNVIKFGGQDAVGQYNEASEMIEQFSFILVAKAHCAVYNVWADRAANHPLCKLPLNPHYRQAQYQATRLLPAREITSEQRNTGVER